MPGAASVGGCSRDASCGHRHAHYRLARRELLVAQTSRTRGVFCLSGASRARRDRGAEVASPPPRAARRQRRPDNGRSSTRHRPGPHGPGHTTPGDRQTDPGEAPMTDLHVYDTTLRDGAQQEGLNLSVARQARRSPRTSTSSASASSRAAGPGRTPRTPSSSPARPATSPCATRRSRPSGPPAGPVAAPTATRSCAPCSTARRRSSPSSPSRTPVTSSGRCARRSRRTSR